MAPGGAHTGRGPAYLWLAVAYMINDCIGGCRAVPRMRGMGRWRWASIKLLSPVDLPDSSMPQAGASDSDSSSSSGGSGGARAVFVDKASLRLFKFQRGELVVLKSPEEPSRRLVRRLVALEGDWVAAAGGRTERVPKGNCWVEADSGTRAAGGDSLVSWGAVPLALIEGRVSHVLWPPARWGRLPQRPGASTVVGKAGSLEFLTPPERDDWWS